MSGLWKRSLTQAGEGLLCWLFCGSTFTQAAQAHLHFYISECKLTADD